MYTTIKIVLEMKICCLLFNLDESVDVAKKEKVLGYVLIFVWHGYLWYDKAKINVDFKNHYVRWVILRLWNKYKLLLYGFQHKKGFIDEK